MRAHQEKMLNAFHMRCLRRLLGITWQDKITNKVVLEKAGIPSLYTLKAKAAVARTCDMDEKLLHSKRPFIWRTGNREKTNRTTPTTLHGRMQARPPGTSHKHRLLESYCHRQDAWRHTVKVGLSQYEETQRVKAEEKRLHKKTVCLASRPSTAFTCSKCDRDCHSRIGLHSHNRRCTMGANLWSFETDRCQ